MKHGNLSIVYGLVALLSVSLLLFYLLREKKRERSFLHLFICVAIINSGYFLLSIAPSLTTALIANAIAYFGTAYSVLAMVYIILDVCQMKKRKWLHWLLWVITTAAFALAASGKWLGLYYRSAQIVKVNGMTRLVKDYGPLHILYTVYLLGYVALMIATIAYAARKKRLASGTGNPTKFALGNIIPAQLKPLDLTFMVPYRDQNAPKVPDKCPLSLIVMIETWDSG